MRSIPVGGIAPNCAKGTFMLWNIVIKIYIVEVIKICRFDTYYLNFYFYPKISNGSLLIIYSWSGVR